MREIINAYQAEILRFLETTVDATNEWIRTSIRIGASRYHLEIADLRERGLVFAAKKATGKCLMRLSITDTGRQALDDYIERHGPTSTEAKVKPLRINVMESDPWVPPKTMYVRNSGNGHYPSRGAC